MNISFQHSNLRGLMLSFAALLILAGCSGIEREARYPTGDRNSADQGDIYTEEDSIFGPGGLTFSAGRPEDESETAGLGINSYLWRASLDTISFMPLVSADPFGGVIITDWYRESSQPNMRYKLNIFITDKHLKASALRVSIFRQTQDRAGSWVDTEVNAGDARQIEDAILTRARQLRVKSVEN